MLKIPIQKYGLKTLRRDQIKIMKRYIENLKMKISIWKNKFLIWWK